MRWSWVKRDRGMCPTRPLCAIVQQLRVSAGARTPARRRCVVSTTEIGRRRGDWSLKSALSGPKIMRPAPCTIHTVIDASQRNGAPHIGSADTRTPDELFKKNSGPHLPRAVLRHPMSPWPHLRRTASRHPISPWPHLRRTASRHPISP
jgi:hypothetical protein